MLKQQKLWNEIRDLIKKHFFFVKIGISRKKL